MDLPLEKNTAGERIAFCQEIPQNPRRVTASHLVSGQAKVHAFEDVHKYCWYVLDERPGENNVRDSCHDEMQ